LWFGLISRYQVKGRDVTVLNVDINNFDFDYVVLVKLSEDYRPSGMWKLSMDKIRSPCANREKFRKFQLTQKAFKQARNSRGVNFTQPFCGPCEP
jgi:hypothetical protein